MAMFKAHRCSVIVFPLLLAGLLLSYGCATTNPKDEPVPINFDATQGDNSLEPRSEVESRSEVEQSPAPSTEVPAAEGLESVAEGEGEEAIAQRLAIAGINDPQAVKDFVAEMNSAAAAADPQAIAALVHYPFAIYDNGNIVKTYETSADLLADFDQVVTPSVITAMSQATYEDLFINYQGAMISNGAVWFGQFDEGLKILAINS
jgi:hypothetical protein